MIKIGGIQLQDNKVDQWKLIPVPDEFFPANNSGCYRIQNVSTGKYLQVTGSSTEAKRALGAALTGGPIQPGFDPAANNGNGSGCGSDQWYLLPVGNATPAFLTPSSSLATIADACKTSVKDIGTYKLVNRSSGLAVEFINGTPILQGHKFGQSNPQALTITPIGPSNIDDNEISPSSFIAYPNPASKTMNIVVTDPAFKSGILTIMNILGEKVAEIPIYKETAQIDITDYKQGIYFFQLMTGKSIITKRVIVQK